MKLDFSRKYFIEASGLFDQDWYLDNYSDVEISGMDPVLHYISFGGNEGRDPGPQFNNTSYLAAYPEVIGSNATPLEHYLCTHFVDLESPLANDKLDVGLAHFAKAMNSDVSHIRRSQWFDSAWYCTQYPDVPLVDPARHYVEYGASEGRDPGPRFSTALYLEANPDVADAGANALLHYILWGFAEGRRIVDRYEAWVVECDTPDEMDRKAISKHIQRMSSSPLISIVVPTYNTCSSYLIDMMLSVKKQIYENWELCIVDDASTGNHVMEILSSFARDDSRIKVKRNQLNSGISSATNAALAMASGDFFALLDHDDMLHETALYMVAVEIQRYPDVNLIFSDSDHIDASGHRFNPYFKMGWNYEVMLGQNLISHLGVYRRDLISRIGGLTEHMEGSQDYDLALRVIEESRREQIRHIPAVLYHWRRDDTGSSFSDAKLDLCVSAARRAVNDHLQRKNVKGRIESGYKVAQWTRVVYPIPENPPHISIILCGQIDPATLDRCIAGMLTRTAYQAFELLLFPEDGLPVELEAKLALLAIDPRVRVVRHRGRFTQTATVNVLAKKAVGEVLVFIDSLIDIISPLWLDELVSQALRADVGAAGPQILYRNGHIEDAGSILGLSKPTREADYRDPGYFGIFSLTREISVTSGACFATRRSVFDEVGGFDELFYSISIGVIDLCLKLRRSELRVIWTPFSSVYHYDNPKHATAYEMPLQSHVSSDQVSLTYRWGEVATTDLFYNPNLSLEHFAELNFPPRLKKPWAEIRHELEIIDLQSKRAQILLRGISPKAKVIEIGASYSPIAPKSAGWNTTIVDHAARPVLVEKYRHEHNVWIDRIEEVDFVWTSGTVADAVPATQHGTFDVFIASHVIEHCPDLISFLNSAEQLLSPKGMVVLAIPDKRYCFDYFRPLTTTSEVLSAHRYKHTRHSMQTAFEHLAYTINNDGVGAWGQANFGTPTFANSFKKAIKDFSALSDEPDAAYNDFHAWKFTPSSFTLILLEIAALGLSDWRVDHITPAAGCEFHVRLTRGGGAIVNALSCVQLDEKRMNLLKETFSELRDQLDLASDMLASPCSLATPPSNKYALRADIPPLKSPELVVPFAFCSSSISPTPILAVLLHLYYEDLAAEFRSLLEKNIGFSFDLFITTSSIQQRNHIEEVFSGWSKGSINIKVVENRGRDIAPKLTALRDVYDSYDFILQLHSKKSLHSPNLAGWREFTINNLIGSPEIVSSVFEIFTRRPSIGIIAAQHFAPISKSVKWGKNFPLADGLARRMGIILDEHAPLDMPSGSMFWVRSKALRPLLDLDLTLDDFPEEKGQLDATLAHAIERLFFFVSERAGYEWIKLARVDSASMEMLASQIQSRAQLDKFVEKNIANLL